MLSIWRSYCTFAYEVGKHSLNLEEAYKKNNKENRELVQLTAQDRNMYKTGTNKHTKQGYIKSFSRHCQGEMGLTHREAFLRSRR